MFVNISCVCYVYGSNFDHFFSNLFPSPLSLSLFQHFKYYNTQPKIEWGMFSLSFFNTFIPKSFSNLFLLFLFFFFFFFLSSFCYTKPPSLQSSQATFSNIQDFQNIDYETTNTVSDSNYYVAFNGTDRNETNCTESFPCLTLNFALTQCCESMSPNCTITILYHTHTFSLGGFNDTINNLTIDGCPSRALDDLYIEGL